MYRSFVVRIYPDVVQEDFFVRQFGCCRHVFNTFLDEKKLEYDLFGRYLSFYDCSAMLTEQKKYKTWLKEVDSIGLIEALKNLENAFDRFFNGISNYPRYKSKYNRVQSYQTNNINNNIRIEGCWIRLPKVCWIRFRTKQRITGKIQSVTVKRKSSGKYYVSILCKNVTRPVFKSNNRSCGIDLGISRFVTINTGEIIHFPQQNKIIRLNKRIHRLQRKLSKKQFGSKNYNKIKKKIELSYEKIHNILDYHFLQDNTKTNRKISDNLTRNTKHQGHAKKQQTIKEYSRKIMAHVHKYTRTKST